MSYFYLLCSCNRLNRVDSELPHYFDKIHRMQRRHLISGDFFFLFLSFFPECVILLSQQIKWLSVRQTKPKFAQHSSWIMKKTQAGFSFSVHLEGPDTASLTCKRSTGGFHGYRCIYNSVGTLLILPKRKSAWPQQAQKSIVVLQRTWAPAKTRRGKKEPLNRFSAEGDVVSAKVFLEESD